MPATYSQASAQMARWFAGDDAVDRPGHDGAQRGDDRGGGGGHADPAGSAQVGGGGRDRDRAGVAADAQRDQQEEQALPAAVVGADGDDVLHLQRLVLGVGDGGEGLGDGGGRGGGVGRRDEEHGVVAHGLVGPRDLPVPDQPAGVVGGRHGAHGQRAVRPVVELLGEHLRLDAGADHGGGQRVRRRLVERAEVGQRHAGGEEQRDEQVPADVAEGAQRRDRRGHRLQQPGASWRPGRRRWRAGAGAGEPARCRGEAEVVMRSLVTGAEGGGVLPSSRSCIMQLYAGGTLVPHGPHEEERP